MEYDLYAVVNHFGRLGAGHYVAYCKNRVDGRWHGYNDRSVSELDESEVPSSSAYLLFYARRDLDSATVAELFPRREGAVPVDVSRIAKPTWRERCRMM